MKRLGNVYDKICDMENLRQAHMHARRDKTNYNAVQAVDRDIEHYLSVIQQMLQHEAYIVTPQDYRVSTINDKGKERKLWKLPYFPHRIIQWAIMLQIEPTFEQVFCYHTCASLKKRGIKHAYLLTKKYLTDRAGTRYCLKIDISKFYPNINHTILKKLLRKKFKDYRLLRLLDRIIDSYPGDKGVPIGSYLSQFLANYYLAYFDHWLKENMQVNYVVRYMDDVVVLGDNKTMLHNLLRQMSTYLDAKLKLKIKPNWQVFPVDARGVDFVGYRFFHDYILLRKTTCKNFKHKMLYITKKTTISYSDWCSVNSYIGWLKWCDSWRLSAKYTLPIMQNKNFLQNLTL